MTIKLTPQTQELIERDVERGSYANAADYLKQAVALLHEQEQWLAENRDEIREKIEAGWASAQRGELMGEGQVLTRLAERRGQSASS